MQKKSKEEKKKMQKTVIRLKPNKLYETTKQEKVEFVVITLLGIITAIFTKNFSLIGFAAFLLGWKRGVKKSKIFPFEKSAVLLFKKKFIKVICITSLIIMIVLSSKYWGYSIFCLEIGRMFGIVRKKPSIQINIKSTATLEACTLPK